MYDADVTDRPCSEHELFALVAALGVHRRGLTSLQLARESGLSTVVVVPSLADLMSHGLVVRSDFGDHGARAGAGDWIYRLTVEGRRLLASAAVPVHH